MNLLIKGAGFREGYVMIAGPGDGILKMLEFGRVGVVRGRPYEGDTGTREAVFDIIAGVCRLEVAGGEVFDQVGGRSNPFSAGPTLICLPPGTQLPFHGAHRQPRYGRLPDTCRPRAAGGGRRPE